MSDSTSVLGDKSHILVFTYAKAGFGHLRVTDALYHGLPAGVNPLLLESQDRSLTFLHRFSSIHPIARSFLEWIQRGRPESVVTYLYRRILNSQTSLISQQLATIIDQRIEPPTQVIVVSTHFGLAHQIASAKTKLEYEKKIKIFLAVQVTDDSPQKIWYVPGADLTFVPSQQTKEKLLEYGKRAHLPPVPIEVLPYPVSPTLAKVLTENQFEHRMHQMHPGSNALVNISIPISGAAVGLKFYSQMMDELYLLSQRFRFLVVVKSALPTQRFINELLKRSYVNVFTSSIDKGVVEQYEQLYQRELIGLEVTKPSEQAFKALVDPERVGGSLLLFSQPVGRQEYDNLKFLARHNLIPHHSMHMFLWSHAAQNKSVGKQILIQALHWRGIQIPTQPDRAAQFIKWCLDQGIFSSMVMKKITTMEEHKEHFEILGAESTHLFWHRIAELTRID